jgi:hypothetical protein
MITEEQATINPTLTETVVGDSEVKTWLVNYVGNQKASDNEEVTVEMIVETMSEEFPEFLLAVAEENWIRGYHQALDDVDAGRRAEAAEA